MKKPGRPKKSKAVNPSEGDDPDNLPSDEEVSLASEHEPEVPPLAEEPAPPAPTNLFSSGVVKPAKFAPLDAFLASPKPLRPPTGTR